MAVSGILACTVRDCGLALERVERRLVCPRGHSYDVARSGYVNLLQPQDRRSKAAGDTRDAMEARARLLSAGVGRTILDAVVTRAAALAPRERSFVVDLGSGSGEALALLAARRSITGIGIDLSVAAVDWAARRYEQLMWVVANADRRLPLVDHRVDLILSLHGRRNPAECARVLSSHGVLLVAVPADDDLIELRALVQGEGLLRDRAEALAREHEAFFTLTDRTTLREHHRLDRSVLALLLRGTYRGSRRREAVRLEEVEALDVTLASDVVVFAPRLTLRPDHE